MQNSGILFLMAFLIILIAFAIGFVIYAVNHPKIPESSVVSPATTTVSETCADGTDFGQCSLVKPKFCENGDLINMCSQCGCPDVLICQADGKCVVESRCESGVCCDINTKRFLSADTVCQEEIQTEYSCPWGTSTGSDVGVRYQAQYCSGATSTCAGEIEWNEWSVFQDCLEDETCSQGECKKVSTGGGSGGGSTGGGSGGVVYKCIDGTPYGQCSQNKPKFCSRGILVDACGTCGCPSLDYNCMDTGVCSSQ